VKALRPHLFEFLQSGCILSAGSNEYWLGWGTSVKISAPASDGFSLYAPDFFLKNSTPWNVFPYFSKVSHEELTALLLSQGLGELEGVNSPVVWKSAEFEGFSLAFQDLQQKFKTGILKKAVPIILEEGEFQGTPDSDFKFRGQLLFQLLRSTQNFPLFLYGFWDSEEGILGATPEILFKQSEPSTLSTVAIAGTRRRVPQGTGYQGLPSSISLLNDPKEMEEHRIVIEGISNSLSALGEVKKGITQELELPTLVHLWTPMTLSFRSPLKFETVVRHLHPTPALGAFPKEAGQRWLETYPLNQVNQKRERFGAPFGATWGSGESLCVVAIRNIQWRGSTCFIGAGCGVVPASEFDKECNELRAKIQAVKKSFNIL
jgi:menaquinone-specific isochorismate synthase